MATKEDIKQALYDELVAIVANETSVTTPEKHADELQERDSPATYPFLGFECFGRPLSRGLGPNLYVANVAYSSGTLDYVEHARDTELVVHLGAQARDSHLRDQLYQATRDHFDAFLTFESLDDLHDDIGKLRSDGYTDLSNAPDGVHGDRLQYTLEYTRRFRADSVVTMDTIDVSIEDLDESTVYDSDTITA